MENKKNKTYVVIGVSVLLLVTLTLLGLTYAYYKTRLVTNSNTTSVSVTSKKLEVKYVDGTAELSTDGKISPGFTATKEFSVENTGDEDTSYGIVLDKITNTFERKEDWTYELKRITGTESETETVIASGQIGDTTTEENKPQYIYLKDTVKKGETNKYKLEIAYAYLEGTDQSTDMNKHLAFRVNIADAKTVFDDAVEGTLLSKIGETLEENDDETPTIPGQQTSKATEAYIGETEDDYGTSYYYRGKVTNNYLNFGGMCWRIVRIQGNGSIKIVLADAEHTCNDQGYDIGNTTSAFINTSQAFNSQYNTKDKVKYVDSDIQKVVNEWFNGKAELIAEKDHIDEEAEWCIDVSEKTQSYGADFGPYTRLYPVSSAAPSLRCDFEGADNSKAYTYQKEIGLLSADEVAFAGGSYSGTHTYYLKDNTNSYWWTLSPSSFDGGACL